MLAFAFSALGCNDIRQLGTAPRASFADSSLIYLSFISFPRDALDLRISRGIRKPCYSTSLPFLSLLGGGAGGSAGSAQDNGDEEFQHSAPVVAVEALSPFAQHPLGGAGGGAGGAGGAGSVVSQFVSIDEAGLVIFWVTSEKGLSFLDAGVCRRDRCI
jgi:hypothetical protein